MQASDTCYCTIKMTMYRVNELLAQADVWIYIYMQSAHVKAGLLILFLTEFLTDSISSYRCTGRTFMWCHLLLCCCLCNWPHYKASIKRSETEASFLNIWVQCGDISIQRWCSEISTLACLQVKLLKWCLWWILGQRCRQMAFSFVSPHRCMWDREYELCNL